MDYAEQLIFLTFGFIYLSMIFVTYSFQYYKILSSKITDGISHTSMIIGNISSVCSLSNTLIFFFTTIKKCPEVGIIDCINSSLGLFQIICQFICYIILYLIFSIYYRSPKKTVKVSRLESLPVETEYTELNDVDERYMVRNGGISFLVSIASDSILIGLTVGLLSVDDWNGYNENAIIMFARTIGVIGTISVVLQYFPQIKRLYINKNPGTVSKVTYILLAIGNLISFFYLIMESASDFTTWTPYLLSFMLQMVIFSQIIYYENRLKKLSEMYHISYDGSDNSE